MKALSIRQPYVDRIFAGTKKIEYRTWATNYRGPLVIHAATKRDPGADPESVTGGFVGVVDLVDCVERPNDIPSRRFHWILRNPRRIPFVPAKGKLGLITPPAEIVYLAERMPKSGSDLPLLSTYFPAVF